MRDSSYYYAPKHAAPSPVVLRITRKTHWPTVAVAGVVVLLGGALGGFCLGVFL